MATITALLTVEEFRKLKDPPGVRLELHNGEVVEVARPKLKHWRLQKTLANRFDAIFGTTGEAGYEFPFRPWPEHNLRVADVAWLSRERLRRTLDGDVLGAPEIVVEVPAPSNTASEMLEKKHLCFDSGCEQFWILDPKRRFIEVECKGGIPRVYRGTDRIPIGNTTISVDEIFSEVEAEE